MAFDSNFVMLQTCVNHPFTKLFQNLISSQFQAFSKLKVFLLNWIPGREDEDVVDAPHVRAAQVLGGLQHGLRVLELLGGRIHEFGLRPDVRPGERVSKKS